jgi:hypothetical protein
MIPKIELFFLVLSAIYCVKFIFEFIFALRQDNPEPIKISSVEKVLLYLASSYIITALIDIIFL